MPRVAREKSSSGIYHVILRGINRQSIFETDHDKYVFLNILRKIKIPESKNPAERIGNAYTLYAYCLLDNHVHLLIKEEKEDISKVMKRLTCAYVPYFNKQYDRVGQLFQDRFKSEPCNDIRYFSTLIRYIHRNCIKAGLCSSPEEYHWSSWREYITEVVDMCDIGYAYESCDKSWLIEYVNSDVMDKCLDLENAQGHIRDAEAKVIMQGICGVNTVANFQNFDKQNQRRYASLMKAEGLSIRQIVRLTGMTLGVVSRIK